MAKPMVMAAPADGGDDLTALNGVGPKLAVALNAEGIYTLAQIASWTEANVLWIDENLPGVRGRASRNGWVAVGVVVAGAALVVWRQRRAVPQAEPDANGGAADELLPQT